MQNKNIKIILRYIVLFSLYAVVFAPLLLCADFFFPAIFPKAIYIRLLVEVALIAYIPLAMLEPKYRPKFNIIYISIIIFALVVLVTSIFGQNFSYSMWGNYERMGGIFSWVHYWILILIASSVLTKKKDWMKLFNFSLACAVLMSFYGFIQRAGLDHFAFWTIYETNMGRITSTIGNPAFFAVYLLFNISFGLFVVINRNIPVWWRVLAGSTLIPLFVAYFMTGVRGAAIGLIFGIGIFLIGYFVWIANKKMKKITGGIFIGFIIVLVMMYSFKESNIVQSNEFTRRIFNITLEDSTIQTRLLSWGVECKDGFATCGALKGIQDNFWLGVGPQRFDVIFNKYFDSNFYTLVGTETWWDRAHNMVLEVFSTMGIFGLLSYLGVGLSIIYSLLKIGKQEIESRVEILIIFAFLGAYFIQNLFVFDTVSSYIVLAVFIAYVVSRTMDFNLMRDKFDKFINKLHLHISDSFTKKLPEYWLIGLFISALIIAPCAYAHNIKLLKHNRIFLLNLTYAEKKPLNEIIDAYREIVKISDFDNREVAIKLGQYSGIHALDSKITLKDLKSMYSFVMRTMEESIKKNPEDVRLLMSYGNTLNVYAEIIKQYDIQESLHVLNKSESALREAAKLSPNRQQIFYSLANSYMISGNIDQGVKILEHAVNINKNTPKAHWILSFAYAQAGKNQKAIDSAERALKKGYHINNEKEVIMIAKIYVEKNDYEGLLMLYKNVVKNLHTGTAQAKLAATLAQMGRKQEAIEAAREVLNFDPKLKEQVDEFIKQIEKGEKINFLNN